MRVIAGEKKGFPLKTPKGLDTRPTSDKIKGAIFNSIGNYIGFDEKQALDCFAGSGSLGIEFLSRGGGHCTFFDISHQSILVIKENIQKTAYIKKSKVIKGSVIGFLERTEDRFDIVFIDPPYGKKLAQKVIDLITEKNLLNDKGLLVVETGKEEIIEFSDTYLVEITEKKYGETKITTLVRS